MFLNCIKLTKNLRQIDQKFEQFSIIFYQFSLYQNLFLIYEPTVSIFSKFLVNLPKIFKIGVFSSQKLFSLPMFSTKISLLLLYQCQKNSRIGFLAVEIFYMNFEFTAKNCLVVSYSFSHLRAMNSFVLSNKAIGIWWTVPSFSCSIVPIRGFALSTACSNIFTGFLSIFDFSASSVVCQYLVA